MFEDAARARGLFSDKKFWMTTVIEAFEVKKNLQQRIRWLSIFLATAALKQPAKILDYILKLKSDWLVNTRVPNSSIDQRRQYVLSAIEWYLRADGVKPDEFSDDLNFKTACEKIGLPRPENINFEMDANV